MFDAGSWCYLVHDIVCPAIWWPLCTVSSHCPAGCEEPWRAEMLSCHFYLMLGAGTSLCPVLVSELWDPAPIPRVPICRSRWDPALQFPGMCDKEMPFSHTVCFCCSTAVASIIPCPSPPELLAQEDVAVCPGNLQC